MAQMPPEQSTRERIIRAVVEALRPLDFVQAVWEGGAAAFGRVDEWSDIDFMVAADDDSIAECFEHAEAALKALSDFDMVYEVPQPPVGFTQKFYHLENTSRFLLIDLAVAKMSQQEKFLESEVHGHAVVHFDKKGVTNVQPIDPTEFQEKLRKTLQATKIRFDFLRAFFEKELNRGNYLEALDFYLNVVLGQLVLVLRIKHAPFHYSFRSKYVYRDLPRDVVSRLEELYLVGRWEDLKLKHDQARAWFREAVQEAEKSVEMPL
jgi:hypothetical protein